MKQIGPLFTGLFLVCFCFGQTMVAAEPDPKGVAFFEKKIRPVLVNKCYKCHSEKSDKVKGGLSLDTRVATRMGGESGEAVIPGDADNSPLIQAIRFESFEMPPGEQLPETVIADFVKWVEMGAPDPRDGKTGLIRREINFEEARKHWAFQNPQNVDPPSVNNEDWPREAIDRFVLANLEQKKLEVVADADKAILARRLYFDLIGLPPTPEQLDEFLADQSSQALENLVDSLLASPQFGERWGRHWLDVARFAESNGRERNYLYPHAWRYRDYVIKSFNDDKPYDQFIREQIAGDLLDSDDAEIRNEQLTATGFLAIGPKLLNERNREIFLMDIVDEQIDVTSRAFMAFTVACARCHDHKFDPIPTAEYYSLAGIFRSTDTLYSEGGGKGSRQNSRMIALAGGDTPELIAAREAYQKKVDKLSSELQAAQKQMKRLQLASAQKRNKKQKKNTDEQSAETQKPTKNQTAKPNPAQSRKQIATMKRKVAQLNNQLQNLRKQSPPSGPVAMGVAEGKIANVEICIRGDVSQRGDRVPRAYLTILSERERPTIEANVSGRLELAGWIANENNPMTSRVIVNRIWHYLFGHGLVRSVDNFGTSGEHPTHPELLDHLAISFMEQGWSVKQMIRRIVLSRTYGLSSDFHEKNYQVDPDNFSLWRMNSRRLDAESLRDAMLAASGQIDLTARQASEVSKYKSSQGVGRGVVESDFDIDSKHRSVYLPIVRNAVPNSLKVFDFAEPSIIVGKRAITTVPAQALYMMNNPFVIEQADHLAQRLLEFEKLDDAERIDRAYELVLSRKPTTAENGRAIQYISETSQKLQNGKLSEDREITAWSGLCQALFATGEFRYIE